MRAIARFALAALLLSPAAATLAVGCGSDPTSSGTSSTNTGGAGATGGSGGKGTTTGSTSTGGTAGKGGGTGGSVACLGLGAVCAGDVDCCAGTCVGGVCNLPACTSDGQACAGDNACCSGICAGGTCTPLNTTCKTLNNACSANTDCCSGFCKGGQCKVSSFCSQEGDVCDTGATCCGGLCNKTSDAGLGHGICGAAPTGAANCGRTDGMLCDSTVTDGGTATCGGDCCSRLCAPYGPTGVNICQPASGCHVVGDLCTKDGDCCGSAGLPGGSGNPVTCDITAPATVGVCRNPMGCKPDGNVCKLSTMSCNASCDCCSGNCNNEDTCKLDSVGIPRCAPAQCVNAGEACATSASCCNGLPCVPSSVDGGAPFVCFQGGCVGACGLCTIDADCCVGTSCIVPIGSTKGVCGPCVPGMDGGTDGGGGSDGGGMDGGTIPDSGTPDSGPTCALYGQQCGADGDCCNMVPCSATNGPCNGGTGCTCHNILK